jgi:hypothetical protein
MGRRLPRPTPETAQVVHQREAFLGALRGRSNVPIPVGRDANSLARSRAGGASASAVRAYQDEFVLAGGEETVELTYLPLTYSEHAYHNGVYQREGDDYDWTRESGTRSVTVKTAMDARAGDILIVEYLYYAGTPVTPVTALRPDPGFLGTIFGDLDVFGGTFNTFDELGATASDFGVAACGGNFATTFLTNANYLYQEVISSNKYGAAYNVQGSGSPGLIGHAVYDAVAAAWSDVTYNGGDYTVHTSGTSFTGPTGVGNSANVLAISVFTWGLSTGTPTISGDGWTLLIETHTTTGNGYGSAIASSPVTIDGTYTQPTWILPDSAQGVVGVITVK